MRLDLVSKYDMRIPRYTSYPTAPHFSPSVDGRAYRTWLSELKPETELSLYLHIAYCADLCWFCGCHTKATHRYEPVAEYMKAVHREIAMIAAFLPDRMRVRHVHFGGGSPTILKPGDLTDTIGRLRAVFNVADDAEIAVEIDPRTTNEAYCRAMAACGVNRVSLGVQDFNDRVQDAINRIQPFEQVEEVIGWLRTEGIREINLDLVYGLPHQTTEGLLHTIDLSASLKPRRLSLFGYAHVPWMKRHQALIAEDSLPSVEQRWQQYERASVRLVEKHGFVAIGLDHFAVADDSLSRALREGRLHRNFQGYTTDSSPTLIAFGASGIGFLPQGYIANVVDIPAYKEAMRQGKPATTRGIALSDDDRIRASIIERLMCDLRVDVEVVARSYGRAPQGFRPAFEALMPMQNDGLLTLEEWTIAMTEEGRPLVRAACAAFDSYLRPGEQKHSKAV